MSPSHRIDAAERRAWKEDGFFIRTGVFARSELEELRTASEAVVERATQHAQTPSERYEIDGNRYCEAGGSTLQF